MDTLDSFLNRYDLMDADDIDQLLELASFVRQLAEAQCHDAICRLIRYTVEHSCYEAFSWLIGILQEEIENAGCALESFECVVGRSVPDYDEFISRLNVDLSVCTTGFEKVYDKNGEVESFFNVITYRTGYANIALVSSENFDTKYNDYVQYKLVFTKG